MCVQSVCDMWMRVCVLCVHVNGRLCTVCVETAKECTRDWGEFVIMYLVKVALYCVHTKISSCVRV